jgi:glycosyltransferase involved in cell wall biosynthesis/O-antigen/teichoic acid export membrane protein
MAAGMVGFVSYACTVVLAHLLSAPDYSDFAAAQMLVNIVGVVAAALTPLPLVQAVRSHSGGSEGRRRGMAFAWMVSVAAGFAAAAVAGMVAAAFAAPAVVAAVVVSAIAVFVVTPVWGWLQGELRFLRFATTTVTEVGIRLAFSVTAALVGWGAGGALAGTAIGVLAVLLILPRALRRDLVWRPGAVTDGWRWKETGDIAVTQLVVAALIGADVVLVALLADAFPTEAAGYQALSTLAKAPVYVAAGAAVVVFPLLRSGQGRVEDIVAATLRSFAMLALPAAVVVATAPVALVAVVLPQQYAGSLGLLPLLAAAGLGYAAFTVSATVLLGVRAYGRSRLGLLTAVLILPICMILGWRIDGVSGLAVGAALGALTAGAVMCAGVAPLLPSGTLRRAARGLVAAGLLLALLELLRPYPVLWLALACLTGTAALRGMMRQPAGDRPRCGGVAGAPSEPATGSLRVLHLGFQDPMMPGAGGGALRTHEINRRLAQQNRITVLVQRFPGWVDRDQDGVRYVHVGIGSGRNRLTRLIGYVALIPVSMRRHPADLIVEDFFAPISTLGAPFWTRRPTIGVVQWLNAGEKARQYKLPLQVIERLGVRRHHRLIAVSGGVAERLKVLNPRLAVHVIGNGVSPEAFDPAPCPGKNVVYLGRLESQQKGTDLLLRAWAQASRSLDAQLIIAGLGPDEQRLRRMARELGIQDRVEFAGWVTGQAKYQLLASARLVALPSRFETFGIVAIEALATGTPVIAFDIPCLREVVPDACGRLIEPFDVESYGAALVSTYQDEAWLAEARELGRTFAAGFTWDRAARQQQEVYVQAASSEPGPRRGRYRCGP